MVTLCCQSAGNYYWLGSCKSTPQATGKYAIHVTRACCKTLIAVIKTQARWASRLFVLFSSYESGDGMHFPLWPAGQRSSLITHLNGESDRSVIAAAVPNPGATASITVTSKTRPRASSTGGKKTP
jgi:hypothetical protein